MIININREKIPWYKSLYTRCIMFFQYHCPITRHIYDWYFRKTQFRKFTFPAIKNFTYPSLSVADIMSVQPLKEPKGTVFYMDFVYTKRQWYEFWKRRSKLHIKNRHLNKID